MSSAVIRDELSSGRMGFEVYDYRTVNRNVLVTPEIRARLYHMAPGQVDDRHSHDLGHEVFLILEGRAGFEIAGAKIELGPGEMCIALADQVHQVRNVLAERPTIMYLSVTPHVQPTHTGRAPDERHLPPRFADNSSYHVVQDLSISMDELLARQEAAATDLAIAAQDNLTVQQDQVSRLRAALAVGDQDTARAARDAMWAAVYALHKRLVAFESVWNETAPRASHDAS